MFCIFCIYEFVETWFPGPALGIFFALYQQPTAEVFVNICFVIGWNCSSALALDLISADKWIRIHKFIDFVIHQKMKWT